MASAPVSILVYGAFNDIHIRDADTPTHLQYPDPPVHTAATDELECISLKSPINKNSDCGYISLFQ